LEFNGKGIVRNLSSVRELLCPTWDRGIFDEGDEEQRNVRVDELENECLGNQRVFVCEIGSMVLKVVEYNGDLGVN
jgi:hypothetical protein